MLLKTNQPSLFLISLHFPQLTITALLAESMTPFYKPSLTGSSASVSKTWKLLNRKFQNLTVADTEFYNLIFDQSVKRISDLKTSSHLGALYFPSKGYRDIATTPYDVICDFSFCFLLYSDTMYSNTVVRDQINFRHLRLLRLKRND
jgi:hypothetical protein